jgi:F5/8 type C domain
MKLPWNSALQVAEHAVAAESALHAQVRLAVRALWDACLQLEASSQPAPHPLTVAALRREALRVARHVMPLVSLADTAHARLRLTQLVDEGVEHPNALDADLAHDAHLRALVSLEADHQALASVVRRRQLMFGLGVLAGCLIAALAVWGVSKARQPVDLALGKPWTTSSKFADCRPALGDCGGYPMTVFFHTIAEAEPWFRIDLGQPTAFSALTVVNRKDMLRPRAVPLVLEVSDDGATYREVQRHNEVFDVWTPQFPTVTARYVRLRVARHSTLHLEAVQVHP